MSEVLSRKFVAIDYQGNVFPITDIVQFMRNKGFKQFLQEFGFSHGKIKFEDVVVGSRNAVISGHQLHLWIYKKICKTEKKYIIKDVHGRHYSPDYLISVFFEAHQREAEVMWDKSFSYRPYWAYSTGFKRDKTKWYRHSRYYKTRSSKALWQANLMLLEEGVKPIRNMKDFYDSPYDDPWHRKPQRSWKSHRQTQYKAA